MSLNSVITNSGAMVALESLDATNSKLDAVQKQVSTGYRVADATDDGAAFAVAQSVRSQVGALTSVNQQLGGVQGVLSTSISALTDVSNTMSSMRDVLVKMADGNVSSDELTQYTSQYNSLLASVNNYISGATYNGTSLLTAATGISTVQDENGTAYAMGSFGSTSAGGVSTTALATALAAPATTAAAQTALATGGSFATAFSEVSSALNYYGSANTYVSNQISYNSDKIDSLNSGVGALVDADMAKESAQLSALQVQQQLSTQALTIANQAPQALLKLFNG